MKDYQLTKFNLEEFFNDIQKDLELNPVLIVSVQSGNTGKWGMARLWRSWMATTAKFMADRGVTMPLMIKTDGTSHGTRPFNAEDAHELFSVKFFKTDENGVRPSWSKKGRSGMRPATKGERLHAMNMMSEWATEKGIYLFNPRDSEYDELNKWTNR